MLERVGGHYLIVIGAILLTLSSLVVSSAIAGERVVYGLSSFGDLKYGKNFKHFDYVNPDAPKGGKIKIRNLDSFDSVNPFILKGRYEVLNADVGGDITFNFSSLMTPSHDEPDALYPLVAKEVLLDDDRRWVEFVLRDGPKFHDGTPITVEDVAFSFKSLKYEGHPSYRVRFRDIEDPIITGSNRIRFPFKEGVLTRSLPLFIGDMSILSKSSFANRKFKKTTMIPLLGSGPYKMVKVDPGRSVTYARVKNHWAEKLPVHIGRYNFDTIQVDYYRDRTIALEAFFAGEYDFREEFTSRSWATEYTNKPAFVKGLIKRKTLLDSSLTGYQAYFLNTRRPQFKDRRVRQALSRMFDYEWTNKNLFYNSYERLTSFFENSTMKSFGVPSKDERALLEPWRGQIPEEVFGEAFIPSKTNGSGKIRNEIKIALKELKAAGWTIKDRKLVNEKGEQMSFEFLLYENSSIRIINPYLRNLERIGVDARVRLIDAASWQNRMQDFDFDIISRRMGQSPYPGAELRDWWSSQSADIKGGLNIAGVKNPAVDALVDAVVKAEDKEELVTAARALDRVLMWGHYTIQQWFKASHFIAFWDKFGKPDAPKPGYDRAVLHSWWFDKEKAAKISAALTK
ncbi:MAG: ABC transporter substrate-binding protein [Sneathiella sp.]|nr:ABC transporter substrate-binding protein [Sneathiella sp.]